MSDDSLETRDYKPGAIIFAQGEVGDEAFIIESGRVEIARGDGKAELIIGIVNPGDLIGEMALIDSAPRMATARAMGKTTCIVIPKRVFGRVLKQSSPVVVAVLNTLLRRLRNESRSKVKTTLG